MNISDYRRAQGFTLVELMVTLAVSAILVGVGVPAFDTVMLNNKLRSYSTTLAASVQLARSEAAKRKTVVTMCVSTDGALCTDGTWEQGWILLSDGKVLKQFQALASEYKIMETTAKAISIDFEPTGMIDEPKLLKVCRYEPVSTHEREVTISALGRTSVAETTTGECTL